MISLVDWLCDNKDYCIIRCQKYTKEQLKDMFCNDLIKAFTLAKQALYDHVRFKPFIECMISDDTMFYWKIIEASSCAYVYVGILKEDIYKDRYEVNKYLYDKRVYRGEKLTMIVMEIDSNIVFSFFDNEKEI